MQDSIRFLCIGIVFSVGCGSADEARSPGVQSIETAHVAATATAQLPRSLRIVAHEDDDLVFEMPSLSTDLMAHEDVRTIYLTAGDAGRGARYWHSRQQGIFAAYAQLAKCANVWMTSTATYGGHEVRIYSLQGATISLIFLNLPDGWPSGVGVNSDGYESLEKLWLEKISAMHPLDDSPSFTKSELITTLAAAIEDFLGNSADQTALHLLNCQGGFGYDHSDHRHAAMFAAAAQLQQGVDRNVYLHWGDDISLQPPNLSWPNINLKWKTFLTYAEHDPAMCKDGTLRCINQTLCFTFREREYKTVTTAHHISLNAETCTVTP